MTTNFIGVIPYGDKVLVQVDEAEAVSTGGIILPDFAKQEKSQGTVLQVGNGKVLDNGTIRPVRLSEGQRVVFGKYAGDELTHNGKPYRILRENEILAVLSNTTGGEENVRSAD